MCALDRQALVASLARKSTANSTKPAVSAENSANPAAVQLDRDSVASACSAEKLMPVGQR